MSYFIHRTNDTIDINGHTFDLEVFTTFDPDYKLPNDCIARYYIQDKKHYFSTGKNQIGGNFPWKEGDMYIDSLKDLLYLKEQFELDKKIQI
ncbi:MAG: hypothetical protein H8D80_01870 [Proteobacteria bacterium]|nr:hypothetical protein [Pseudomonadota bacterium]